MAFAWMLRKMLSNGSAWIRVLNVQRRRPAPLSKYENEMQHINMLEEWASSLEEALPRTGH